MWTLKKRWIPLLCAGILIFTQSATAFAQSKGIPPAESLSASREAAKEEELSLSEEPQINYGIELTWEKTEFEYGPLWNPKTHSYDSWGAPDNRIQVSSTSDYNAPMTVTLTFVAAAGSDVNAVFSLPPGEISSEDLTIGDGTVSFALPRLDSEAAEISLNMALKGGELADWKISPDRQVGAIQVEITPLPYDIRDLLGENFRTATASDAHYSAASSSNAEEPEDSVTTEPDAEDRIATSSNAVYALSDRQNEKSDRRIFDERTKNPRLYRRREEETGDCGRSAAGGGSDRIAVCYDLPYDKSSVYST